MKKIIYKSSNFAIILISFWIMFGIINSISGVEFLGESLNYGIDEFKLVMIYGILGLPYIFIPTYIIV